MSPSLNQTATVWKAGELNGSGERTYANPVTFKCRWQTKVQKFQSIDGNERQGSCVIYTSSGVLELGDKVALGDITGTGDPFLAAEVVRTIGWAGASPSLGGGMTLYKSIGE